MQWVTFGSGLRCVSRWRLGAGFSGRRHRRRSIVCGRHGRVGERTRGPRIAANHKSVVARGKFEVRILVQFVHVTLFGDRVDVAAVELGQGRARLGVEEVVLELRPF